MTVNSTISRANQEIRQENLWRAKEILGSSLSTYSHSPDLMYTYANVLMQMGDLLEAGRFVLLAVESPTGSELDAIELFLARTRELDHVQLLQKFPRNARLQNRDQYPQYLRNHLIQIGAPDDLRRNQPISEAKSNSNDRLYLVGCGLVAFCTLVCTLVGLTQVISWFW